MEPSPKGLHQQSLTKETWLVASAKTLEANPEIQSFEVAGLQAPCATQRVTPPCGGSASIKDVRGRRRSWTGKEGDVSSLLGLHAQITAVVWWLVPDL